MVGGHIAFDLFHRPGRVDDHNIVDASQSFSFECFNGIEGFGEFGFAHLALGFC